MGPFLSMGFVGFRYVSGSETPRHHRFCGTQIFSPKNGLKFDLKEPRQSSSIMNSCPYQHMVRFKPENVTRTMLHNWLFFLLRP